MIYNKILITGGSGFLGRHVCQLLKSRGYFVTVVDKVPLREKEVQFYSTEFSNQATMVPLLKQSDAVIHLAAMVGVDNCRLHPKEVMKINYTDSIKLIDTSIDCKVKKFVFSSSSEVYGNSREVPFREDSELKPNSLYGKTKIMVEEYLKVVNRNNPEFHVGIVRLFNIYGPGQRGDFVIPKLIKLAQENRPITIYGDGKQTRCFTFVKDASEGLVKLLEYEDTSFETVNIGSIAQYTISDLAGKILELLSRSKSEIVYQPYGKKGVREEFLEIQKRIPATGKSNRILGFEAKTRLDEGLKSMI